MYSLILVVSMLCSCSMAATTGFTTEGQFVQGMRSAPPTTPSTMLRGGYYKGGQTHIQSQSQTTAPLVVRGGKALSAAGTQVGLARDWSSGAGWQMVPSRMVSWHGDNRIPMNQDTANSLSRIGRVELEDDDFEEGRGKNKYYKKYKKYMLPLLLAYKLKFFTLVPILIGGLVLLTGATGLAGFFFALFAATMGLKGGGEH